MGTRRTQQSDPETARFTTQDAFTFAKIDNPPTLDLYLYANDNPTRYTDPDGHEPADANQREPLPLSESQTQALVQANEHQLEPMTSAEAKGKSEPKVVEEGRHGPHVVDARYGSQRYEDLVAWGRQNPDLVIDGSTPAGQIARLGQRQARGDYGPYESPFGGYTDEAGERHTSFCLACHGNNEVAELRRGAGQNSTEWARFNADVAIQAVGLWEVASAANAAKSLVKSASSAPLKGGVAKAENLVTWVDEGGNLKAGRSAGMPNNSYEYQSSAPGARSNVSTGRSQAPYLEYTNESGKVIGAKYDGARGAELLDRKMNVAWSKKMVDQATRQADVAQHYGLKAVWELPNQAAVDAANRFLQHNNVTGITVRLFPKP